MTEQETLVESTRERPDVNYNFTGTLMLSVMWMIVSAGLLTALLFVTQMQPNPRLSIAFSFMFAAFAMMSTFVSLVILKKRWRPGQFGMHFILNFQCIFLFIELLAIAAAFLAFLNLK